MTRRSRSSGMALVLVLGLIVITTLIVLGFMLSVTGDLHTSKGFESQVNARMLADSAVNIVISQVRDASTLPGKSWASQPGLIHTFDASGSPAQVFKLYSSDRMVVENFDPSQGNDLPPSGWRAKRDLYTDLNSPLVHDGKARFPIVDGNGIASLAVNGQPALTYDTDHDGQPDVEGFAIDPAHVSYDPEAPLGPENQPVPMPVKWLYLLKDGQAAAATDAGSGVKVGGVGATPTKENPIVARIAFWTDDETAKVNLNTASEGTYWDPPVAVSQPATPNRSSPFDANNVFESDLAWRPGVQGEYQRYPGHPATTSLSPVLGAAIMRRLGLSDLKGANRAKLVEAIADLAPRVGDADSSKAGTVRVTKAPSNGTGSVVALDSDRLYATTDELRFTPGRTEPGEFPGGDELGAVVERSRFFLTTNSRAPEENLFNQPRVAIWPITLNFSTGTPALTPFDRLISFCSTVGQEDGTRSFSFTRRNPRSSTVDWSPRNQQLYAYLQRLTGRPVPGYGGTFSAKYGADRDQILTEIFDYIRCTNLRDNSPGATSYTPNDGARGQVLPIEPASGPGAGTRGFGRIATISEMALVLVKVDAQKGGAEIQNNVNKKLAGFEPGFDFNKHTRLECVLLPELFSPMAGYSVLADDCRIVLKKSTLKVDGKDPFNPATSQPAMYAKGRLSNPNSTSSKIGGVIGVGSLIEDKDNDGESAPADSVPPNGIVTVSGVTGDLVTIGGEVEFDLVAPASLPNKTIQHYKFVFPSTRVPIPDGVVNTAQAKSNPKDIDPWVDGKIENVTNDNPIRDFLFAEHYTNPTDYAANHPVLIGSKVKGMRMTYANSKSTFRIIVASQDTVRSVVPTTPGVRGDMRIIAGQTSGTVLDDKFFSPAKGYDGGGRWGPRWAHSLSRSYYQSGRQTTVAGADFGSLLADYKADAYTDIEKSGQKYSQVLCPDVPAGIDGVENADGQPGDWDNGPGYLSDGPYLNKADEGVAPWTISGQNVTPYLGVSIFSGIDLQSPTYFSPNRQIPSAVMFGSLPTGVKRLRPWQTLLFRPARSYLPGGENHPGSAASGPPDHLLLDLFWMPVVEPYAISEPFSTAGKINLNYQIAPFTYIRRDTGLRAALKPVMITALNPDQTSGSTDGPQKFIRNYKAFGILGDPARDDARDAATVGGYGGQGVVTRRPVQLDATLNLIDATRFQPGGKGVFRSASEICDVPLVPADVTGDPDNARVTAQDSAAAIEQKLAQFWRRHRLTGDNSLERPYAHLYPRVTTKSNTYTVHVRVQTLLKNQSRPVDTFDSTRDIVTGEFRGSFVIERYLDQDTTFDESEPGATLGPCKFRVVRSKQFSL